MSISLLTSKVRVARDQMVYLPRTLTLIWAAAGSWTSAWMVLLVVQGMLPVVTVTLTRSLVDSLVTVIDAHGDWQSVRPTLALMIAMAGAVLLGQVLQSISSWVRAAQSERVQDHIRRLIHQKSTAVDLAFYESPAYYDQMHRAQLEARYRPVMLLENLGKLMQNAITLVAMGAVLIPFGLWLPVALIVGALPAFYVVLRDSIRQHQWRLRTTADERRTWYYDRILTSVESAAELRIFGLAHHFQSAYQKLRRRLRDERLQLAKERGLASLGASVIALSITAAAMAWMVWRALQGQASLGDLALLYQAFNQGQGLMRSLLESAGQIYSNSLFLGDLFEFLELEAQVLDPVHPTPVPVTLSDEIRFRHVTFRYPGSDRPVLQDFDLTVPAGQIVAIVGANGAGKSTLIKLLCRFYDPEAGCIEFDGSDLREFSIEKLRRRITVLFQEPVHFHTTAGENIALGDPATPSSAAEIEAAARAAAADTLITRLPQGYETLLGKRFAGGTELSAGQWQRIALARAFRRQASIILLDEPTSAMDSWSEADWLSRFRSLAAGRTAIVITHRFTTAMYADVIHVMTDGRIVESGSHVELQALGGRYAQSWSMQMQEVSRRSDPSQPSGA